MRNKEVKFNDLPMIDRPRSTFRIPQEIKLTGNVGDLIPFYLHEVLPGDTCKIKTSKVIRLTTPITPFMDNLRLDTYYFFVPTRLLWKHWQNFMGESETAWYDAGTEYTIPQIEAPADTGWAVGGIADYLGYPTGIAGFKCSALPIRAYAKICEDWFRSEATQDPLFISLDDADQTGTNSGSNYINDVGNGGKCFVAGKIRDYFVSALPEPQYGDPVSINIGELGGPAPVYGNGKTLGLYDGYNTLGLSQAGDNTHHLAYGNAYGINAGAGYSGVNVKNAENVGIGVVTKEQVGTNTDNTGLYADVTIEGASLITINELRMAFQMQKWQETLARSGNRYIEIIKGLFGVTSPDARLQRSEYLGGNSVPVQVNQVLQTSQTGTTPQGTTGAYSLTTDVNFDCEKSFTEHGYIIGCMVVRYKHTYQQGCDKSLLRKTKNDYYNPIFANIGEQAIKNAEIYAQGPSAINEETGKAYDDEVFGYQEAWAEYRFKPNRTAGQMRSTFAQPLDMWHLGDLYEELPHLGPDWIKEDANNVNRVLTVGTETGANQFIGDIYVENVSTRIMPTYSIPGLMDHH